MKQGKPIIRVITIFTTIYVVAIVLAIFYIGNVVQDVVFDRIGSNVKNMAILIANEMDLTDEDVDELKNLPFAELPQHEANKHLASFFDLYDISENIRFAYLSVWLSDEDVVYFVSEENSQHFGAQSGTPLNAMWLLDVVLGEGVFDAFENDDYYNDINRYSVGWEELQPMFINQEPLFDFFDDEHGKAIVGMAPVYTNEGSFVGLLGIDYYYDYFVSIMNRIRIVAVFILILPAFVISLTNYLVTRKTVNKTVEIMKEQRRIEAVELASHVKDRFLAHMSHEIRTPMNSIVGFSELAMDDDISKKTEDYLSEILKSSQWLLQIINDLLDTSKFEFGQVMLDEIPFDIDEIFASCNTLILPKAVEKGLKLSFITDPMAGKRLLGDPLRLRQVIVNLLLNAVKYTNTGSIEMRAGIISTTESKLTMSFEVQDTGIGITDEQKEIIFDPFAQAESGILKEYGGSGLGLSVTKKLIEMMDGTICVDSKPGEGSIFKVVITFKFEEIDEELDTAEYIIYSNNEKPIFEGEVLLCEDNSINQQIVVEQLARVGLKTVVAGNGKIGVDLVEERVSNGNKQFDLIFMDIHMPVMDGIEATAEILKLNTGVPIIAVTANVMRDDLVLYKKSGMADCLGKPFTSLELWRCLVKYLKPIGWQNEETSVDTQD